MNNVNDIFEKLAETEGDARIFDLNLRDFKKLYFLVIDNVGSTPVDIVINDDWVMVQFSRISTHRIRVQPLEYKFLGILKKYRRLTKTDFEFALRDSSFYGKTSDYKFHNFLIEEISLNWHILFISFIGSAFLFKKFIIMQSSINTNAIIIASASVFLSIFLLFAVSQNIDLIKNEKLFMNGVTHKFFQTDKYISILVIIVIVVSTLNEALNEINFSINIGNTINIKHEVFFPWISALSLTILIDSFMALINYYFERVKYTFEADLTKNILDEEWKKKNKN